MKRTGSNEMLPSKRIKTDDEMPPPSFVPRQSSSSTGVQNNQQHPCNSQTVGVSKPDVKFKLHTSIKDVRTSQNGYFSDDDEDDEDLYFRASQIEEREMKANQKKSPTQMTYSEFQGAERATSTQNDCNASSQMDLHSAQKIRVLQNKCSALEKQLKRSLPNLAKAQTIASQANCEVNELRIKLRKLQTENEELKKEKLNEADRVSTATSKIRNENDLLRKQVSKLESEIHDSNQAIFKDNKSPLDPLEVKNARLYEMTFDDMKTNQFAAIIKKATEFKNLKFDEGNTNSIFQRHLISLQLKIADMQSNFINGPAQSLGRLQTLKFHNKNDNNDIMMFNEVTKIIFEIAEDIKSSGLRHLDEHFVRKEFAFKQTQYCSDQYFGDKENLKEPDPIEKLLGVVDIKNRLTKSEKLFSDEIRVDQRRLIAIISILMKNSKNLSELMLTQNVSAVHGEHKTLIDIFCEIIDPHILQSRFLYKNSGITEAFADLAMNLSSHYGNFTENIEIINDNFRKFFSHLLAMSTNNPRILLSFSVLLINISKHPNGTKILKTLCIKFPSSNLEYSHMFKIYQIPRCGCMLQIFFILLTTAFRYLESVRNENLDVLFELASNLNTLGFLLISNEGDLEFLKPQSSDSSDLKNVCKCYTFLVSALIILNGLALRHRNVDSGKYFCKISDITKSTVINLATLLSYSGQTIDSRSFPFEYNAINEIHTWIKYGDIYIDEFNKYFNCKDQFLNEECHEKFLEKLLSCIRCDYSYTATHESNPELSEEKKALSLAKEELWKEINEDFKADESCIKRTSFR